MKCQHCGINFDDSDRECPICGARAGSRGRLGAGPKPGSRARLILEEPAERRTGRARPGARKARASAKPIREHSKKGRRGALVAILAVVLINALPLILSAASDIWEAAADALAPAVISFSDQEATAEEAYSDVTSDDQTLFYEPGASYDYDPEDYRFIYADLHTLTGGSAVATLPDGSALELGLEPGEMGGYQLAVQDSGGIYSESGYTWCSYIYPEEVSYSDSFPPDQYDCFTLSLTAEDFSYSGGSAIPERYACDEYGDRWFWLYYAPETGELVLSPMDGNTLLGAAHSVQLKTLGNS